MYIGIMQSGCEILHLQYPFLLNSSNKISSSTFSFLSSVLYASFLFSKAWAFSFVTGVFSFLAEPVHSHRLNEYCVAMQDIAIYHVMCWRGWHECVLVNITLVTAQFERHLHAKPTEFVPPYEFTLTVSAPACRKM